MKKVFLILIISFYTVFSLFSQKVERLGQINDLLMLNGRGGGPGSPNEISVNEVYDQIKIMNKNSKFTYFDINTLKGIAREDYRSSFSLVQKGLKNFDINFSDNSLEILNEGLQKLYLGGSNQISAGISFILKKGNGYIVFYVDEAGVPGAADTDGKIYSNYEAYDFLEQYDKEKYGQSLKRANELGLYNEFLNRNVLIWGETYFSSIKNISCVYGENPYIRTMDLIQYDQMGYGYEFYEYLRDSKICIVSPQGKRFDLLPVVSASNILSEYTWVQDRSLSWYVGFGGNIYYYIAGEEYTEVFRIRRTWGNPDFYAMAINGYTEDEYGKYVKEVLPKMSKADLRLLRNTIFALYGVHFKSEDLAKYFDKLVWYTDKGLTSGEVTLPAHRQKLVEMIQKLEK